MQMLVFSTKSDNIDSLNVMQSDYDDTWTQFDTGNWASWDIKRIPRWKKALHGLVDPFVYRSASYIFQSFQARRKYRSDRILINPDTVEPADFIQTIC